MKRYRIHLTALWIVTVWAVLSYAYLGVEDGSSGLSLFGWISGVFFRPGAFLMQMLKGSHSNADLPLMAATGWLTFSLAALAIAQLACLVRRPNRSRDGE